MLVDTLSKIEGLPVGSRPQDRILADLGVDAEDGLHYFVTTDAVGGDFDLGPADLATYLHSAIEAAHCDPPDDVGDWEGISLMMVRDEDLVSELGGWVCKKCDLIVGGAVETPPEVCPICAEEKP